MSPSKQNKERNNQDITLAAYETNYEKYIERTRSDISDALEEYLDYVLTKISPGSEILEIGSATGRDADYIESKGHTVTRTDAVTGFVEYMRKSGHQAQIFNVLTDAFNRKFDVVLATAVLLHLTAEQFGEALTNIHQHLRNDGIVILAVKIGDGEEYSTHKLDTPRYFKYWQPDELSAAVSSQGFNVQESRLLSGDKWLTCIATKN